MKIFIAQSLVHYLPDLLAFKGDVAALRASFFTRSDGFPPEPLIFNFHFLLHKIGFYNFVFAKQQSIIII
jgi:hypothetical protein